MKGFRKGKVPMALLKKQFGPRLIGEAMQESVDGAMQSHLEETGDRPAMQPEVKMVNEDWKEGDDVVVSMTYEKLPEIPEVDFKAISLEKMVVTPAEADVLHSYAGALYRRGFFADMGVKLMYAKWMTWGSMPSSLMMTGLGFRV